MSKRDWKLPWERDTRLKQMLLTCPASTEIQVKLQFIMNATVWIANFNLFYFADIVDDYFCALFRHNMLLLILDIVFQHIPNLGALNLNQNKLRNTDKLALACKKFPQLKILYLGDNEVSQCNWIIFTGGAVYNKFSLCFTVVQHRTAGPVEGPEAWWVETCRESILR